MARNSGIPFSIRNWVVEVLGAASTQQTEVWVRVRGLSRLSYQAEAEMSEGSGAEDAWKEPYVAKRGAKIKLSGRRVADAATGAVDPGQAELDRKATMVGFDADTAIRLVDAYGHAMRLDAVVESGGADAGEDNVSYSWDLQLVGEPQMLDYVQLQSIELLKDGQPVTSLSLAQGQSETIALGFVPTGASNKAFSAASADPSKVRVKKTEVGFELAAVSKTSAPVRVLVKTMNNQIEQLLEVSVE